MLRRHAETLCASVCSDLKISPEQINVSLFCGTVLEVARDRARVRTIQVFAKRRKDFKLHDVVELVVPNHVCQGDIIVYRGSREACSEVFQIPLFSAAAAPPPPQALTCTSPRHNTAVFFGPYNPTLSTLSTLCAKTKSVSNLRCVVLCGPFVGLDFDEDTFENAVRAIVSVFAKECKSRGAKLVVVPHATDALAKPTWPQAPLSLSLATEDIETVKLETNPCVIEISSSKLAFVTSHEALAERVDVKVADETNFVKAVEVWARQRTVRSVASCDTPDLCHLNCFFSTTKPAPAVLLCQHPENFSVPLSSGQTTVVVGGQRVQPGSSAVLLTCDEASKAVVVRRLK